MEVKEEYRGKIRYLANKNPEKKEHVVIEAIFEDVGVGNRH